MSYVCTPERHFCDEYELHSSQIILSVCTPGRRFRDVYTSDSGQTRALFSWGRVLTLRAQLADTPEVTSRSCSLIFINAYNIFRGFHGLAASCVKSPCVHSRQTRMRSELMLFPLSSQNKRICKQSFAVAFHRARTAGIPEVTSRCCSPY